MMGRLEPLGWKLSEPVAFVDSRDHPAIQVADVVAGNAAKLFGDGLPGCETIVESISRHGHAPSIWPDMDVIDPNKRSAAVNNLILSDLAKRAERHGDPYENLEATYPNRRSELGDPAERRMTPSLRIITAPKTGSASCPRLQSRQLLRRPFGQVVGANEDVSGALEMSNEIPVAGARLDESSARFKVWQQRRRGRFRRVIGVARQALEVGALTHRVHRGMRQDNFGSDRRALR
jgi:hypothetical protein